MVDVSCQQSYYTAYLHARVMQNKLTQGIIITSKCKFFCIAPESPHPGVGYFVSKGPSKKVSGTLL